MNLDAQAAPEINPNWLLGTPRQRRALQELVDRPMPSLADLDWAQGTPEKDAFKDKILIVSFFAPWNAPSVAQVKENRVLLEKFKDQPVAMISISDKRGSDVAGQFAAKYIVSYPVAVDPDGEMARTWEVQWWPCYYVIDHHGVIRAAGIKPRHLTDVVEMLLQAKQAEAEQLAAKPDLDDKLGSGDAKLPAGSEAHPFRIAKPTPIPQEWLEGEVEDRKRLTSLIGRTTPQLQTGDWMNTEEPVNLADLRGKVVLIDFWATWCQPAIQNLERQNAMHEKYAEQGLVILGICHAKGAERMAAIISEHGVGYPVAVDTEGLTMKAYKVNGLPDYYLIDRAGNMRIADCRNSVLEEAVALLLAEEIVGLDDKSVASPDESTASETGDTPLDNVDEVNE